MKKENLEKLMDILGVNVIVPENGNFQISCLCKAKHAKLKDEKPSAGILVNENGQSAYNCFACKTKGNLFTVLKRMFAEGIVSKEVLEFAQKNEIGIVDYDSSLSNIVSSLTTNGENRFKEINSLPNIPMTFDCEVWPESSLSEYDFSDDAISFIAKNIVFCEEYMVEAFKIGLDKKENRTIFPIRRMEDNALVGISGRANDEKAWPHYKNYLDTKKKFLYGEHFISKDYTKPILVVEGMRDVVYCNQFLDTVGTMGTEVTKQQLEKLFAFNRKLLICGDGDKSGREYNDFFRYSLRGKLQFQIIEMEEKQDPNDMPAEFWNKFKD